MSDRIDREAAIEAVRSHKWNASSSRDVPANIANATIDACIVSIRALPAAVPVVDVEKAAQYTAGPGVKVLDEDRDYARDILEAGYAGSVSREDITETARVALAAQPGYPAAKRLLAAVGK